MELELLEQGAVKYGTPSYIFDIDILAETVQEFRDGLKDRAGLCYALKANPFLTEQMADLTDRLEICSMGEYRICKELDIPPEKMLISGVLKKREEFFEILEHCRGRSVYTVESLNQFQHLVDWCEESKEPVSVYLRLSSGNQFGMDWKTLLSIVVIRGTCPLVKIKGLHFFSGTRKKSVGQIQKELEFLDERCRELEETYGFSMETLEYGPGLDVPYFIGQKDSFHEDVEAIAEAIEKMEWNGNVILEMGRALAARCGYYLTKVRDVKQTEGKDYCIVDGGIHQMNYDGQIRGMYQPYFQVSPAKPEGKEAEWTVYGALCTTNDILLHKVKIRDLKIGSILIFERTGAYSMMEGMALFLSRELPAAVLYSKEMGWKIVRERKDTYPMNMKEETKDGSVDGYFNGN